MRSGSTRHRASLHPAARAFRHGKFEDYDSPLSEYGVLGFEYWPCLGRPEDAGDVGSPVRRFRQWRAIIIDQYIAACGPSGCGPTASCCCCRTASKGQGPEHSSAWLERFLQLCAEDTIQVRATPARPTTSTSPAPADAALVPQAAGHLHPQARCCAIRWQSSQQADGLPPPRATSSASSATAPHRTTRPAGSSCAAARSPTISWRRARRERLKDAWIVRLEQLYPFPGEPLAMRLKRMTNLQEVV